jgi:CRISPR-associated protein Csa3
MESYINIKDTVNIDSKGANVVKILISTIYEHNSLMLCATRFSVEKIILLVDNEPKPEQKEAIKIVKSALGGVVDIKEVSVAVYDIVDVAKKVVDILDSMKPNDYVYVNATAGRKTQSLGLIYGCYARINNVKELVYVTEEDKQIINLPKLSIEINGSQCDMLKLVEHCKFQSIMEMSEKIEKSRAIVYRNFETLKDKGMLKQTDNGIEITDFGKLVLL